MKLLVAQSMMLNKFLHYQLLLIICFQVHQHILSLTVSKPGPLLVDSDIQTSTVSVDSRNSSFSNKHFRTYYIFMVGLFSQNLTSLQFQLKMLIQILFVLLKDGFVRKIAIYTVNREIFDYKKISRVLFSCRNIFVGRTSPRKYFDNEFFPH